MKGAHYPSYIDKQELSLPRAATPAELDELIDVRIPQPDRARYIREDWAEPDQSPEAKHQRFKERMERKAKKRL